MFHSPAMHPFNPHKKEQALLYRHGKCVNTVLNLFYRCIQYISMEKLNWKWNELNKCYLYKCTSSIKWDTTRQHNIACSGGAKVFHQTYTTQTILPFNLKMNIWCPQNTISLSHSFEFHFSKFNWSNGFNLIKMHHKYNQLC